MIIFIGAIMMMLVGGLVYTIELILDRVASIQIKENEDKTSKSNSKSKKNLENSNFEEVVFQIDELQKLIDELQKLYEELNIKIDTYLINKIKETETPEISSNKIEDNSVSENTLGTLIINSEDLSDSTEETAPDNGDELEDAGGAEEK